MRYNRECAVNYARSHALCTFVYQSGKDADATAFVSRCIAAGIGIDFECSDPEQLYLALQDKLSAHKCALSDVQAGDIIQIRSNPKLPYKSLIVTEKDCDNILVTAHSYISLDRPIYSYHICDIRCLRIV